jgi:cytosine/uracil/thiamine/allantoin permease
MESLDELSKVGNGKTGFVKHVFNFDEDSKADILNIVQYAVLALIPVVLFNKLMQRYIPEADEEKGSMELTAEVLAQVIIMFLVILIIHRLITFVPTYSGEKYKEFSVTNIILAMLVIVLSLQTKLGEKVSILVDRVIELWEGPKDTKKGKGKGNVKVSQPISQNQAAMNQSLGTTSITSLPTVPMVQQLPDFDKMHQQDNTPLIGAATPGMETMEPMAANFGGGAFGSAFGTNW